MLILLQLSPVYLQDIDILVFNQNEKTKSRRGEYYPQLKTSFGSPKISQAVCKNNGFDGESIIWKCKSKDLLEGQKFKSAQVSCEGWNGPGDKQIVPGSCQLNYVIKQSYNRRQPEDQYEYQNQYGSNNTSLYTLLSLVIVALIFYIAYTKIVNACKHFRFNRPIIINDPVEYVIINNRRRRIYQNKMHYIPDNQFEYVYVDNKKVKILKETYEEVYARTNVR
ncbi:hypothetical protein SS50377_28136 [Spironucleus salmonicida]|uniref:Store-operated calcium entry-associated regulatory factor n=1 Tax=Spironucleus salmonicida TaxID=348837 RepID=V6LE90_9EUKA|nr:hypothetical protein SS50377_28136 [Spironucleus salmonicida]|eukprot:EST42820.1 Hypothetical protein SS50377_17589 [Spironucleus salmonicida]